MLKKIYLFVIAISMAMPSLAFGLGSWATPIYDKVDSASPFKTIVLTWTADAAAATVPNFVISSSTNTTAFNYMKGYYIYRVETDPSGVTAPTDNYDIVFTSTNGADIARSKLLNRDEANTEITSPINAPVDDGFTVSVSGNAVNSASGEIKIYLAR